MAINLKDKQGRVVTVVGYYTKPNEEGEYLAPLGGFSCFLGVPTTEPPTHEPLSHPDIMRRGDLIPIQKLSLWARFLHRWFPTWRAIRNITAINRRDGAEAVKAISRMHENIFQLPQDTQKLIEKLAPTPAECEQVRDAMGKVRPYCQGNPVVDIEAFRKLDAADIRDWFEKVHRPMTTEESRIADIKFEQEMMRARDPY